jgi:hypothetical protein
MQWVTCLHILFISTEHALRSPSANYWAHAVMPLNNFIPRLQKQPLKCVILAPSTYGWLPKKTALHTINGKLQITYGIIQFDLNNLLDTFVSLGLHNLYIKQKIFSEVATSSKLPLGNQYHNQWFWIYMCQELKHSWYIIKSIFIESLIFKNSCNKMI